MISGTAAQAFGFDPFSRETQEDPYPFYEILREQHPVFYSACRGFYAISRFDDVQALSRDWRRLSSADGVEFDGAPEAYGAHEGSFIDYDPPRHDDMRRLLQGRFTLGAVAALEPYARSLVESLFAKFREDGGGDFAQALAIPFPVQLARQLLGFPESRQIDLTKTALSLATREYGSTALPSIALEAGAELREYMAWLLERPDNLSADGVLSAVVEGRTRNDPLSAAEKVGMAVLLFIAATETTAGFLSSALLWLDKHRDQRERLVANPQLLAGAVEELLRYDPPVQNLARTSTSDLSLHGVTVPSGSRILLLHGAACRDERRFREADTLDVARPAERSVAFGEGIHFCLGAPLARLEARLMLETVLRDAPNYRLTGNPERVPSNTTRPIRSLFVSLH